MGHLDFTTRVSTSQPKPEQFNLSHLQLMILNNLSSLFSKKISFLPFLFEVVHKLFKEVNFVTKLL